MSEYYDKLNPQIMQCGWKYKQLAKKVFGLKAGNRLRGKTRNGN